MYNVYQVKINDTLDSIANNFGISKEELISINNMNGNVSYGDFLVVPNNNTNFMSYTIVKGDTLYSIASRYNVSLDSILNLNGLNKEDYIYPGEVIMIPRNGVGSYVVKEGDTLNDIINMSSLDDVLRMNERIYLLPNQLIVYTKSN
ncbi:MAG: LysM peptidoglycan-binding domain-containing protein [Bacilli bacterium]|nr:LysM peptidoglycan-binding domain-containing protein [Bacilli bacterium]